VKSKTNLKSEKIKRFSRKTAAFYSKICAERNAKTPFCLNANNLRRQLTGYMLKVIMLLRASFFPACLRPPVATVGICASFRFAFANAALFASNWLYADY